MMAHAMTALRDAFGTALLELGKNDQRVVVIDADLAVATRTNLFEAAYPDRFFQVGIAEQNMMGIAAGLATMGFLPFTSTLACFASKRALDQIRVMIAQPKLNVIMTAHFSGLLSGKTGKTHQSVQDISIMRSMPNMAVLVPGDAVEAAGAVYAAAEHNGPVYLRVTRDPTPVIFDDDYHFRIGQSVVLRVGEDVTVMTTGLMAHRALQAAEDLARGGIRAHVLHLPTVKPLDEAGVVAAAQRTKLVVTAEDNNILGGLGGAVAEVLGEKCPTLMKRVGLNDTYGESGSNEAMLEKYGLTAGHIAQACREMIAKRRRLD